VTIFYLSDFIHVVKLFNAAVSEAFTRQSFILTILRGGGQAIFNLRDFTPVQRPFYFADFEMFTERFSIFKIVRGRGRRSFNRDNLIKETKTKIFG